MGTPDDIEESDRLSHITGDYYWDREAFPAWQWWATAALCIVLPPVGFFFLAFLGFSSLTTDPDEVLSEDPEE